MLISIIHIITIKKEYDVLKTMFNKFKYILKNKIYKNSYLILKILILQTNKRLI